MSNFGNPLEKISILMKNEAKQFPGKYKLKISFEEYLFKRHF